MSASYKRTQISDSIRLHTVIDPKFKQNTIEVRFFLPLDPKRAAGIALASSLLTTSCRKYPSITALNRKMNLLYGGVAAMDVSKLGDYQVISARFSAISNRYALGGENILSQLLELLCDCLFDPNLEDGVFSKTETAIKTKDLLDTIEADINNKRGYALRQCARLAFDGEPSAYPSCGTKENVLALTPQDIYDAYCYLLHHAAIEIFFVAPEEAPQVQLTLAEAFSKIERTAIPAPSFTSPSPLKSVPAEQTESLPVAQCKMVFAFKSDCTDDYAMRMLDTMYGQTPFSLLFANVREKLSLCYYCASSYAETKRTLFVDCGVEKANIGKARKEILRQLKALQDGDFSDELLENTRLYIDNSIKGTGDSPSSYIRWYFTCLMRNKIISTEESVAAYQAITRERIIAAARSLKLDSVYIMEANGEEAGEDA